MNSLTVFLYLFGHAGAIRRIASSPISVPVGILFVFSAGVARNYDQTWFGDSLWWLFGPLVFSLFSGAWLYLFVAPLWNGRKAEDQSSTQEEYWRRPVWKAIPFPAWRHLIPFYGLFWMTAPIAWLYAIPVERWFDPVTAARWNVGFLTVVSVWRILLMSRVVAVTADILFVRALGRVLLPATIEVMVLGFFTSLGPRLMAGMAGLRNSPAEDVLLNALSMSVTLAFFASIAALLIGFLYRKTPSRTAAWDPEASPGSRQFPYILLLLVAGFCWWMSIQPQREQRLTREAKQLVMKKDWPGLVAFLSAHSKEEFAPAVPLPPTAWEMWHVDALPLVLAQLTPQTPVWVRELYVGYTDAVLEQPQGRHWLEKPDLAKALQAAREVPEVKAMAIRHAEALKVLLGDWETGPAPSAAAGEKTKVP